MSTTVDNSIVIDAPMELVWQTTNDVANWPDLFTEYAKAEILDQDGPTVRFRLTLHPDENDVSWSWVSERTPDPATRTVRAHRIETGPFEHMNLFWEYTQEDAGVRMRWVQEFDVRPGLPFDNAGMASRLNRNTTEQMQVIKERVERLAGTRGVGADGESLRVALRIEIKPGKEADFERLWREQAAAVSELPANLGQSLSRHVDAPGTYQVLTEWRDEASFREFEKSPAQKSYLERLWPLRAGGQMTLLSPLFDVAPVADGASGRNG